MNKSLIRLHVVAISLACLFVSCGNGSDKSSVGTMFRGAESEPEDPSEAVEDYTKSDMLAVLDSTQCNYYVHSSKDCQNLAMKLSKALGLAQRINSPEQVARFRYNYQAELTKVRKTIETLSDKKEQEELSNLLLSVERTADEHCQKYQLPGSNVCTTLDRLIEQIEHVVTKEEFNRFYDVRAGVLSDLYLIHLSAADGDMTNEIRERASRLQQLIEEKKNLVAK